MTAPPRMCVLGALNSASLVPLWGMAPMRAASHCTAWLAAEMNVGLGCVASCAVVIRTPLPKCRRRGVKRSALSTVCSAGDHPDTRAPHSCRSTTPGRRKRPPKDEHRLAEWLAEELPG